MRRTIAPDAPRASSLRNARSPPDPAQLLCIVSTPLTSISQKLQLDKRSLVAYNPHVPPRLSSPGSNRVGSRFFGEVGASFVVNLARARTSAGVDPASSTS